MKKYTIGLITGALLAVSAMMFIGAQNKNLGAITADSITLISDGELGGTIIFGGGIGFFNTDGTRTLAIANSDNGGGMIRTFNADGVLLTYLGTGADGGGGILSTYDENGKEMVYLGTGIEGGGYLKTYDENGKEMAYLGTSIEGGGYLNTYNKLGVKTGYFGTNAEDDGMAILFDRYGDAGWAESGKQ